MFNIWELSICPMLYYSSEVWSPVPRKTLKSLFNITVTYLRVALGLGKKGGAPLASLFWHTGTMLPENRILLNKILFLHHIANLPQNSLAYEFYSAQKSNPGSFPGLVSECEKYLIEWNLTNITQYSKRQWKSAVQSRIYDKNRNQILEWIKQYKKIDYNNCVREKFEMKSYFKSMNIQQSRLYFKILNFITPTVRLNFKSDRKFKVEKWQCVDCRTEKTNDPSNGELGNVTVEISSKQLVGFPDSQEHLMFQCRKNGDLRRGRDINGNANDCVAFFQDIIKRRQEQAQLL